MVLTELVCQRAVWKVPVRRWSVFWGLCRVSLWFPDVLWESQKPGGSQIEGINNE